MKSKAKERVIKSAKDALRRVLNKSKRIKKDVKQAASELTSVNQTLKKGREVNISAQEIKIAINQNEVVEQKVTKAVDDLKQVNLELAQEVSGRVLIESELDDANRKLARVREDLSRSQAKEEEAKESALKDAATGLPNRGSFEQSLDHALIQAKRHGWGLAVLFVDIDNFKSINDSYGHDCGDRVLHRVARSLQSCIRAEDAVCRWGGDEFVCLLLEIKHEADAVMVANNMISKIAENCDLDGVILSVHASIGVALYPADGKTVDALLRSADAAMYKAKRSAKNVVVVRKSADE